MDFTSDWVQLGREDFAKHEVYDMAWEMFDFKDHIFAGGKYGGPLAFIRDSTKLSMLRGGRANPDLYITSASGAKLAEVRWDRAPVVQLGWTTDERLVAVTQDGNVHFFSMHGAELHDMPVHPECKHVVGCVFYNDGVVVWNEMSQMWALAGLGDPRGPCLSRLADFPSEGQPPASVVVIEPKYAASRELEVVVATAGGTAIVLTVGGGMSNTDLSSGPFPCMSVSSDGQMLACYASGSGRGSTDPELKVFSTDFSQHLATFDLDVKLGTPDELVWCGSDAMVLLWHADPEKGVAELEASDVIMVVGRAGDQETFEMDSNCGLVAEDDGVRIITDAACHFLRKVSPCMQSIFQIGSVEAPALLYDAYEAYVRRDPKADEQMRGIREGMLPEAVGACVDAAMWTFDEAQQTSLLRAANHGKAFCDENYDAADFVFKCKVLKVLNNVRAPGVGIPLTLAQYEALTASVLVERLVSRRRHLLAMKLCGFLNLRPDPVCVDWACQKIIGTTKIGEGDNSDDQCLHDQVMGLLRGYNGIKYTAVASSAYRSGRPDLAVMFLEHEPRVLEQVPLLMSMRKHELALEKAVQAGETNLIHLSLLQLRKQSRDTQLTDFFRVVERFPVALRHLIALWKRRGTDYDTLKLLFFHLQQPQEAAHTAVIEAYRSREWDKRLRRLKMAGEFYSKNKDFGFCKTMTEEQAKLLEYQRILEQANMKVGDETAVIDRPLSTNIINLIKKKAYVQAGDLVKKFKIGDKRYWYLRIRALTQIRDWGELEKVANEKKSPIGYRPFVDACIEIGAVGEASAYVSRIPEHDIKAECYIDLSDFRKAAQCTMLIKDADLRGDLTDKILSMVGGRHDEGEVRQVFASAK